MTRGTITDRTPLAAVSSSVMLWAHSAFITSPVWSLLAASSSSGDGAAAAVAAASGPRRRRRAFRE
eukprot:8523577-Alexandrium_andersonii.AAC.1